MLKFLLIIECWSKNAEIERPGWYPAAPNHLDLIIRCRTVPGKNIILFRVFGLHGTLPVV